MLKSHVLNLPKQNTCNGVTSYKTRLVLVVLPPELMQCSCNSSGSQNTDKTDCLKYEMRGRKKKSLNAKQEQVVAWGKIRGKD